MSKKYIGGVAIETVEEMKERHPADFYPTEQALIDAYLDKFPQALQQGMRDLDGNLQEFFVADLGAGDGRWGSSVKKKYPHVSVIGSDIRDLSRPQEFATFFTLKYGNIYNLIDTIAKYRGDILTKGGFDLIIGNPPYSILEDWLDVCFNLVNKKFGRVALLLSLNVLSGKKRYEKFYSGDYPLSRLIVCSTRPSFTENGKTYPGREYGIFEWFFYQGNGVNSKDFSRLSGMSPIDFLSYDRRNNLQK